MSKNGKKERGIGDNSIKNTPINPYEYTAINEMFKDINSKFFRSNGINLFIECPE